VILFPNLTPEEQDRFNDLIATLLAADDVDEATDADLLGAYASRFPRWTLLESPSECAMTLRRLELMALDYYHHTLTGLAQFVLLRSLEDWIGWREDQDESGDEVDRSPARMPEEYAELPMFMELAFPKPHIFLNVHELANAALSENQDPRHSGNEIENYLDIVPSDVRARLARRRKASPTLDSKD
jgi:hypothetical protein